MEASTTPTFINGEPIAEEPEPERPPILHQAAEELDDLEIQVESREWTVKGKFRFVNERTRAEEELDFNRTYVQKPLSYTAMLQFTGLLGDRISDVMQSGVTLDSVLGDAQMIADVFKPTGADLSRDDFASVDAFVRGLAKLASYLPDLIIECQCIWLRVPLQDRPAVKDIWNRSPEDGGLAMQDGEDMLELFLAQNYQELEDFFVVRLRRILAVAQKTRKRRLRGAADPQLSKHSNSTQVVIPSQ